MLDVALAATIVCLVALGYASSLHGTVVLVLFVILGVLGFKMVLGVVLTSLASCERCVSSLLMLTTALRTPMGCAQNGGDAVQWSDWLYHCVVLLSFQVLGSESSVSWGS